MCVRLRGMGVGGAGARVCVRARFGISRNALHSSGCAGECDESVTCLLFRLFSHGKITREPNRRLEHACDFQPQQALSVENTAMMRQYAG